MKARVIILSALLFLSLSSVGAKDITTGLNDLEELVDQLGVDQTAKDGMHEFIDWFEQSHQKMHWAAQGRALDAFLMGIIGVGIEEDWDDDNIFDEMVFVVDEMKSELFFSAADSYAFGAEPYSQSTEGCTCIIYTLGVAPLAFDANGVLYAQFAESIQLEAQLFDNVFGGQGSFQWEISLPDPPDYALYTQNQRAYFRLLEYETVDVRVTCSTEMAVCQDTLRVVMQGGYPTD